MALPWNSTAGLASIDAEALSGSASAAAEAASGAVALALTVGAVAASGAFTLLFVPEYRTLANSFPYSFSLLLRALVQTI